MRFMLVWFDAEVDRLVVGERHLEGLSKSDLYPIFDLRPQDENISYPVLSKEQANALSKWIPDLTFDLQNYSYFVEVANGS